MFIFFKKPLQRTLSLFLIAGCFSATVAAATNVPVDTTPAADISTEVPDIAEVLPFGETMKQFADNLAEEYEKQEADAEAAKLAEAKSDSAVLGETTEVKDTAAEKAAAEKAAAEKKAAEKAAVEKAAKEAKKAGYTPAYNSSVKYRGKTVTTALKNNSELMGKYKLTFYCPCKKCCGKSNGITASGTKAKEGRTAAILNSNLPMGSKIHIEGYGDFIVEDRGSKKTKTIDIFVSSHSKALQYGVKYANVYLVK